ncbi:FAD-binding oxidoreductase [Alicyclobacillus ferrooxydans]|uniref:FAD-binding PCMH-type domain-containing protein n=1 Tax=Alicyclobacillus ferrooxydans TaxID=471514 RepID=A0A0P9CND0_9BACL|nr:FAD-binding oxidoreductase [Alicyclobacillus ferrooxydans]KPV44407.1 hypothetical protein AN477_07200 [Alicyclobacillus ferrooxydans]
MHDSLLAIQGKVVNAGDEEFEAYRSVWNKAADGTPHLIVVPVNEIDVSLAVLYAEKSGKTVCVRGGGHHFAGFAVQDDAVMIHMRGLNHIVVDEFNKTVKVGAGATIGELDRVTQSYGFAVPTGTSSGTGIAGLTLGGGFGHLRRQYGLTIDQLVSARLVLPSGEVIQVSENENTEIFWGIRGGGGNFGVVTEFEFRLHNVGPEVSVLDVFYPISQFRTVMTKLIEAPRTAPDVISFHLLVSPLPMNRNYTPTMQGQWVIRILGMANHNADEGMKLLEAFRTLAKPLLDESGIMPYNALQSRLDANFPDSVYYDGTSVFLETLTPDAIQLMESLLVDNPQPVSLQLWMLGGQMNRPAEDATAFPIRNADWAVFINAAGSDRDRLQQRAEWMRRAIQDIRDHSDSATRYANAIGVTETMDDSLPRDVYGVNYARLQTLKRRIDPRNTFRHNVNIRDGV